MKSSLAALFIVGILTFGVSQNASAQEKFNFVGFVRNIAFPDITQRPIYAVLELSGESPYDHTNIKSLIFTSEAGNIFGYVGEYAGAFDSSSLSFVKTAEGGLASSDYDGGSVIEEAVLTDNNPPPFNEGNVTLVGDSELRLGFGSPQLGFIGVSGTQGLGRYFVSGAWTTFVPEPTSLALVVCGVLMGVGRRARI